MNITTFLNNLEVVSKSKYALIGYALVVIAWVVITWLKSNPKRKAIKILKLYQNDKDRNMALNYLIGIEPPQKMRKEDIIKWVNVQSKNKYRAIMLIGYIATLITVILISSFAYWGDFSDKPVKLINSKSTRLQ